MKNLKHKNIVEYFTDFRHNGEWYIVLEYCGKGDLQNYKKTVGSYLIIKAKYQNIIANCLLSVYWRDSFIFIAKILLIET